MLGRLGLATFLAFWGAATSEAPAEPVTAERIAELPPEVRLQWQQYLDVSQANAQRDAAALAAEVQASGQAEAVRAPDGGDFKLSAKAGDPYYGSAEAAELADVILSYQTPAGGWSKHTGYSRGPRQPGMQWTSQNDPGESPHYVATFDNRSTTEQLQFLANVWLATRREDCQAAFARGLRYVLAAQYPNGGWPQVYPLEGDYHDDITLNDDALMHILELLQGVARQDQPQYALVDQSLQQEAARALDRGLECVMQLQVQQNGQPTAWCAQYDALTLRSSQARPLEPPTLSGVESAQLLKFLMTIPDPAPELVAAIEHGLAWLDRVKMTGLRRAKRDGKTVYEPDPASDEVYWARFYDLATSRPVFPGRDGVLYETFAEMAANNRLGYDYFSSRPRSILRNGQKKWRKMLAKRASAD